MHRLMALLVTALLVGCAAPTPTPAPPTATPLPPPPTPSPTAPPPVEAPLPENATARLGRGTVRTMAISDDRQHIVIGSSVGVYYYDAETFEMQWFAPTLGPVITMDISDDTIAVGVRQVGLQVLDAASGGVSYTIPYYPDNVVAVRYHTDGDQLAVVSDADVVIWEGQSVIARIPHNNVFTGATWQKEQLLLVGGGLYEWDYTVEGIDGITELDTAFKEAQQVAARNGTISSGLASGSVVLLTESDLIETNEAHDLWVRSVAFDVEGGRLASGGQRGEVVVWDAETGERITDWQGHNAPIVGIGFTDDKLITAAMDNTVTVWDAETGIQERRLTDHTAPIGGVAWSPDGDLVAATDLEGLITIWDARTQAVRTVLDAHTNQVMSMAWSPTGNTLATASLDASIILWDVITEEPITRLTGHALPVNSIAYSPDGARLVSGSDDGRVIVWDAETGERLTTLRGHANFITTVGFSPDGERVFSSGTDGLLLAWDAETGDRIADVRYPGMETVAFSPIDGDVVAVGVYQEDLVLYDTSLDQALFSLNNTSGAVFRMVFSPDGSLIAAAPRAEADSGRVFLWDVESGEIIQTLVGHTYNVKSVDFSPDGSRLATGSWDGTILLWDLVQP